MNIAGALKKCRELKGLTQSALAKQSGISTSYLSQLEQGTRDPKVTLLTKLSNALGVPLAILFFLAADEKELSGLDDNLKKELSFTAWNFIKVDESGQTLL
jgi:transcriptional regulator with XRE-family HTH domain